MVVARPVARNVARPPARPIAGGGDGFSPSSLGNLAVWLDAQDSSSITLNGTTVSSWANKGTNGVGNAAQGTAANQPLYVASAINGRPAVRGSWDGSNPSRMAIVDSAGMDYTEFTLFVAASRVADAGTGEVLACKYDSSSGNKREFILNISTADALQGTFSSDGLAGGTINVTRAGAISLSAPFIAIERFDLAATQPAIALSNLTYTTGALAGMFNGTADFSIFSRETATISPFFGYIGEVLFYTSLLTAAQQNTVLNYLKSRWGVS